MTSGFSTEKISREKIFNTWISTGKYAQFIQAIINLPKVQSSSYVCFANVHMIVEAYQDPSFNDVINDADVVAPDGKPLSVFLNVFKGLKQDRVAGMDVMPDLLKAAEKENKSVYLYGSTNEVLNAIIFKSRQEFPKLNICGHYSPPFRQLSSEEENNIVEAINAARPHLVFVALGCPKQEKWMAQNKGKINACMLGVGQAFHTYSGLAKRSPRWMQDLSLEWAFRLYSEPKRLWKRYLVTNSIFLFLTCKYLFARVIKGTVVQ